MTRPQGGFTLLEVLVAVAVFGLLLVGLSQGIGIGLQARAMQSRMAVRSGDLDAVDRALRHMIAAMNAGGGDDPAPFRASAHSMSFVSELPDGAGSLAPRPIEGTLREDGAHRLVLRWRPWLHAQRLHPLPPAEDTELVSGVSQVQLAYYRRGAGWLDAWGYPELPALIRIHVVFPPGDLRHWPDLVAAPALDPR